MKTSEQSKHSSSADPHSPGHPTRSGASVKFDDPQVDSSSQKEPDFDARKSASSPVKQQQEFTKWGLNLPEIDWTDEDEQVSQPYQRLLMRMVML